MKYKKVWAVFFSATETTKKITTTVAKNLSENLDIEYDIYDFTLPEARQSPVSFEDTHIVILGTPVYAGRVPNLLLKYINSITGNDTLAVPIVLYGNRHFDNALIELRDIMESNGFRTIAGGGFVGEHSFSTTLGKGRPDDEDINDAIDFSKDIAEKVKDIETLSQAQNISEFLSPVKVDGEAYPYEGYYQPRDRAKNSIDIRKVVPNTDENCIKCMICAQSCPLGSIDQNDPKVMVGKCMKCCSCVKKCPVGAKHFDDPEFIYHKEELEKEFTRRGPNKTFI